MQRKEMIQFCLAYIVFFAGSLCNAGTVPARADAAALQVPVSGMAAARVPFIRNDGQLSSGEVRFYARMFAGALFVTNEGRLVYSLPQTPRKDSAALWAFSESFTGKKQAHPQGQHTSAVRVSQYVGSDPRTWKRRLATFDSVSLGELYPGIRVSLRASGNNVEKLFYVSPGADPAAIQIDIEGVQSVAVNAGKQLVLGTALGDIVFTAPVAYQVVDGERQSVDVAYVLAGDHHYGFRLGQYDETRDLVIDPLLASTFIGGHNPNPPGNYDDDIIYSMVVAGDSVYVAGVTQSPDFPVRLGYDETLANAYPDGFITLLSADLTTVVASTYIGTDSFDRVTDIALDDSGMVIATGQAGYGFPLTDGAYNWSGTTPVGGGFVARFSADLSTLVASAVVTPGDYPGQLALGNGGIYFGGSTTNRDFPITPGAYRSTCCPAGGFGIRSPDGFAGKLSADLSTLQAMTYLGGDVVSGMAVAPDTSVFITDGWDHEITGYIARFDAGLTSRLAYRSYYPGSTSGSSRTYFNDVAVGDGYVVAAGQTYMNDLPATPGAFDTDCGTDGLCNGIGPLLVPRPDGFVAAYSYDLQSTFALTYLGGSGDESIRSVALDADGNIYLTGETASTDFPTSGSGADTTCGTDGQCNPTGGFGTSVADGFVAKLAADLSQLLYGSYVGGSAEDRPGVIAVAAADRFYAAGYTRSADFPTTAGAFDDSYNGGTSDAFLSLFDAGSGGGANQTPVASAGDDKSVRSWQWVVLDGRGSSDADGEIRRYHWNQVEGNAVDIYNADAPVAIFRAQLVRRGVTRILVFELEVTDDQSATATDQVNVNVSRR